MNFLFSISLKTRGKKRKELRKLGAKTAGASSWLEASTKIQEEWTLSAVGTVQLTGSVSEEVEVFVKSHRMGFFFFLIFLS